MKKYISLFLLIACSALAEQKFYPVELIYIQPEDSFFLLESLDADWLTAGFAPRFQVMYGRVDRMYKLDGTVKVEKGADGKIQYFLVTFGDGSGKQLYIPNPTFQGTNPRYPFLTVPKGQAGSTLNVRLSGEKDMIPVGQKLIPVDTSVGQIASVFKFQRLSPDTHGRVPLSQICDIILSLPNGS